MDIHLDDNIKVVGSDGQRFIACVHCDHQIAPAGANYYEHLARYEGNATEAGPQIWADSTTYIDKAVVFRQFFCPGCYTAFLSEVVPADHEDVLDKDLALSR